MVLSDGRVRPEGSPPVEAFMRHRTRHAGRVIRSIRRECFDHLIIFGEAQLRLILRTYTSYYNQVRPHLSLDKDAPDFRRTQKIGRVAAIPILGGLHHQYVRV
jgi:Integrase core domain